MPRMQQIFWGSRRISSAFCGYPNSSRSEIQRIHPPGLRLLPFVQKHPQREENRMEEGNIQGCCLVCPCFIRCCTTVAPFFGPYPADRERVGELTIDLAGALTLHQNAPTAKHSPFPHCFRRVPRRSLR